jgi:hypothetical protein
MARFLAFRRFLDDFRKAPIIRVTQTRPTCRLGLEELEDRLAPSTDILLTALNASGYPIVSENTSSRTFVRSIAIPPVRRPALEPSDAETAALLTLGRRPG